MNIKFNNGEMIITHSTGIVNKYNKTDCELWLERFKAMSAETQDNISDTENRIKLIDESKSVSQITN